MQKALYLSLVQPALDLVVKKHEDYNGGIVQLQDYFPFGDISYIQMLHVKTTRLVSLGQQMQADPNMAPNYESIEETLYDLINYAVFYLAWLKAAGE